MTQHAISAGSTLGRWNTLRSSFRWNGPTSTRSGGRWKRACLSRHPPATTVLLYSLLCKWSTILVQTAAKYYIAITTDVPTYDDTERLLLSYENPYPSMPEGIECAFSLIPLIPLIHGAPDLQSSNNQSRSCAWKSSEKSKTLPAHVAISRWNPGTYNTQRPCHYYASLLIMRLLFWQKDI